MLRTKELKIISVLKNKNDVVTSEYLSRICQVSDRTIRTYIPRINEYLKHYGAIVVSKKSCGYKLSIENQQLFNFFLNKYFKELDISLLSLEPEERRNYLLHQLLFQDEIKIPYLMNELFISEATFLSDIHYLRRSLVEYPVNLIMTKNTIALVGDEAIKRKIIFEKFIVGNGYLIGERNSDFNNLLSEIHFQDIVMIVIEVIRKRNLKLDDVIVNNLSLHIALVIFRMNNENCSTKESIYLDRNTTAYQVCEELVRVINSKFKVELPTSELENLMIFFNEFDIEYSESNNTLLENEVHSFIQTIEKKINYKISNDKILFDSLVAHLRSLLYRLRNSTELMNPLTEVILNDYSEVHIVVKSCMQIFESIDISMLSDHEISYITIHIIAALERLNQPLKSKVIVVCASGKGSAQMLKTRLLNEFARQLEVVRTVGLYDIESIDFKNIDLIVSSVDLSKLIFPVPVVFSSVFLSDQDHDNIKSYLNLLSYRSKKSNKQTLENNYDIENVAQMIEKIIFNKIESESSKLEVLHQFANEIEKEEPDISGKLIEQISYREKFGSTIFAPGIAVPHPVNPVTFNSYIGLTITENPIIWNRFDNNVSVIIILSPSLENAEGFDDFSLFLVEVVMKSDFIERLQKCEKREDLLDLLFSYLD